MKLFHHPDTFDRMLIAQAQVEDVTLVSADSTFNQYEVSLFSADGNQNMAYA